MMHSLARSTPVTLAVITVLIAAFVAAAVSLFKLTVGGAIALYFVVWWTLLFAVLPLRNQPETRLREKAIWTTLVAGAAFLIALAVFPLAGL